ncbi:MAG: CocE/NonD family hydrolase [candidate division WOR-3 bacterium]|nr:MAG: CocE/NonD family hydrolase [candidate division WOR-3 bacterium]
MRSTISKVVMFNVCLCVPVCIQLCYGWTVEQVNIPVRDNILLSSYIYKPDPNIFAPPWPCIIRRSPYEVTFPNPGIWTDVYGYAVVGQFLRGWGNSQGVKTLFQTDGWGDVHYGDLRDGYDAIEWLASQPWSSGEVAMYGFSGPGVVQYQAAGAAPPHLTCCNASVAFLDYYQDATWPGGEFKKASVEGWCTMQGTPYFIDTVCNHPNEDSFYTCHNLATRWDSAHYPMFHFAGWYDMSLEGGLAAFSGLQAHHHNQKLFVGPWGHWTWGDQNVGHLSFPPNAAMSDVQFRQLDRAWYDYWLHDSANGITEPKVTFYLMGECDSQDTTLWNFWVEADTWPLPEVQYKNYYIREDGLLDTVPPGITAVDTFQYDPADPCPSYGGKESWGLQHGYGPIDNQPIEGRSDVLLFSTPVLTQPLCVIGKIWFTLHGASDRYDTDWTVRVTDVYPDGRSILITDGIIMARHRHGFDIENSLIPNVPDTFHIDVGSTANVFAPGHRLRVIISSSNYPRFEKNPNTGAPFMRNDPVYVTATNTVYRSAAMPSHLILPVYPGIPGVAEHTTEHPVTKMLKISPNPFTKLTQIRYSILDTRYLIQEPTLAIYDANGRLVKSFDLESSIENQEPAIFWHGIDNAGRKLPSGVYFAKFVSGDHEETEKVLLVR